LSAGELDEALCHRLALSGATGDPAACKALVEHLWPYWLRTVRASRALGAFAQSEDHVRDVAVRVMEKIGRADGHGLRLYAPWCERNPTKGFGDWIRIVTKNVIRDYVREQLGSPRETEDGISRKRLLNDFASSPALEELGIRPPITLAQTARELIEFARARLPADQLQALGSWVAGGSFADTAAELGVSAELVQKLVRSAIATLRRQFAPSP